MAWGPPARKWNQILCRRLVPFLKKPQHCCPGHLNGEEVTKRDAPQKQSGTHANFLLQTKGLRALEHELSPWSKRIEPLNRSFWPPVCPCQISTVFEVGSDINAPTQPGFCQPSEKQEKTEPALPSGSIRLT